MFEQWKSHGGGVGCGIDGLPLSEADMQGDPDRRYILDIASIVVLVYVLLPQNNSVLVNLRASLTLWSTWMYFWISRVVVDEHLRAFLV